MPLVAAVACPHTPQLLIRPDTEDRGLVLRVHAAYAKVKQHLTDVRADVICVIVYLPPQPTPRRCHAWGRALREIIDARPERIALMASGGMSHYPGTDRYASPDFEWYRQMLATLGAGRGAETAR